MRVRFVVYFTKKSYGLKDAKNTALGIRLAL